MTDSNGTFPLRYQVPGRAIEADMVLRRTPLAADLRQTAATFDQLTAAARQRLIDDSLGGFADTEAGADPLQAEQYRPSEVERSVGGRTPTARSRSRRS